MDEFPIERVESDRRNLDKHFIWRFDCGDGKRIRKFELIWRIWGLHETDLLSGHDVAMGPGYDIFD
jgi:hypothetical protein